MEDTHKLYEQIESYLSGLMEAEERQLFEEKMMQDQSLKEEVESFMMAQNAITAKGRDEIRSSVDAAFEKHQTGLKPTAKTFTLRRILSVAAAVLLLAVATFILLPDNEAMSPQELFVAHFELPVASNVRSGDGTESWNRAITSFNEKNYDQYIENVSPLFDNEEFSYRNEGYLFLGLSHLQLGNDTAALSAFDQVSRISSSGKDADWYTALTYLKMDDLENASDILKRIINSNQQKKARAEKILKRISE